MPTAAGLAVDPLFSSHMVLQRLHGIIISGTAQAFAEVSVRLHNHLGYATATAEGRWRITLPAMGAGGPHRLLVSCQGDQVAFEDVLVGDVWLCSGQSNMEMRMSAVASRYSADIDEATHPQLRLLTIPNRRSLEPLEDIGLATWKCLSPDAVRDFSAVAYFFGRDLLLHQEVPIGLILSAWGGTIIESWIDATSLAQLPDYSGRPHPLPGIRKDTRRFQETMRAWRAWLDRHDPGVSGLRRTGP